MVGLLDTVESDEFHYCIVAEPACLQEIAVQLRRGTVQIALRPDVAESALQSPVPFDQSGAKANGLLMTIVGTAAEVDAHVWSDTDILRQHIDGSAEGTCAVGRRAHTALYLHRLHAAGEVTHVDPVESGTFGIVHGDAVGGDVDARGVSTAHSDGSIADTITSVRRHRHRRCERQQIGHILSEVHALQLFLRHVGEGHGGLLRGTCRRHLHALQLYREQ